MRRTLIVAALVLGGCSADIDSPDMADRAQVEDAEALGEQLGCESVTKRETDEAWVRELHLCETNAGPSRIYTFNSKKSRDSWWEFSGDPAGYVVLDEGETWAHVDGDEEINGR